MTQFVDLKTKNNEPDDIKVLKRNIQEVRIIRIPNFEKYAVQVTVVSGRSYTIADDNNVDAFDTRAEAEVVRDNLLSAIEGQ